MVGSMNFTAYAAARQWQDLYVVPTTAGCSASSGRLFRRDAARRAAGPARAAGGRARAAHRRGAVAGRPTGWSGGCPWCAAAGAADGTGWRGRTVLRVSMHAWNGERGVRPGPPGRRPARAGLQRAGARRGRVRPAGPLDPRRAGGVPLRQTGVAGGYTHEKLMFVSGHVGSRPSRELRVDRVAQLDRPLAAQRRGHPARRGPARRRGVPAELPERIWAASAPAAGPETG